MKMVFRAIFFPPLSLRVVEIYILFFFSRNYSFVYQPASTQLSVSTKFTTNFGRQF